MTYVLFLTLILWSKGDLFIHLQWCSLKERNHSHLGRLQKPVLSPSNFFCEVALPFDQNLSMFAQDNTLFSHAIKNTISTYDIDADMEFVQKITPPDFQAKNFTPSISPNLNSFSGKKHKK